MARRNTVTIRLTPDQPGHPERGTGNPFDSDLVGAKEAAIILGLENERTRIARYQRQGKMPPTVSYLGNGPVWILDHILDFGREHLGLTDEQLEARQRELAERGA